MESRPDPVPHTGAEGGSIASRPALPSSRDVVLIVLFFLLIGFGFRNVGFVLLSDFFERHLQGGGPSWFSKSSWLAAWSLYLIEDRAALVATVLLYFPVVRREPPSVRRERRGEIFTAMINLYIIILAVGLPVATRIWPEFSPLYVGTGVIRYILSAALWGVVGFHLCEGRYLVPLGGIFIKLLLLWGFAPVMYRLPLAVWGGIAVLAPLLGFLWEIWFLIRAGSGFELFPTGVLPAIRKYAGVFLLCAATSWFLGESPWNLATGAGLFSPFTSLGGQIAYDVVMLIAYLVPLFLLGWPAGEMARRSRKLTLVLLGFVALATLLCVPFSHFLTERVHRTVFPNLHGTYGVVYRLIFPLWMVFLPVSIYRWWVRGYFMRPLMIVVSGFCVAGVLAAFAPFEQGNTAFFYTFGRFLVIVLAVPFLFLRIPPPVEESREDGSGGDFPASAAQN